MNPGEKIILYVDDDSDDRELLSTFMQQVAPELKVTLSENGLKALELLNERKDTKSLPCLIVLDLNMPFLNGRQTFERIKADPQLNYIPIVILSSGENPSDKSWFRDKGIPYFRKPSEFSAMEGIASHLADLCS